MLDFGVDFDNYRQTQQSPNLRTVHILSALYVKGLVEL